MKGLRSPRRPSAGPGSPASSHRESGSEIEPLLTIEQMAEILVVGRTKAYELVRTKQVSVVRHGRLVRIRKADLQRWIDSHVERC